jgi:hypothetical protein
VDQGLVTRPLPGIAPAGTPGASWPPDQGAGGSPSGEARAQGAAVGGTVGGRAADGRGLKGSPSVGRPGRTRQAGPEAPAAGASRGDGGPAQAGEQRTERP